MGKLDKYFCGEMLFFNKETKQCDKCLLWSSSGPHLPPLGIPEIIGPELDGTLLTRLA
jgi:hypothetical protein